MDKVSANNDFRAKSMSHLVSIRPISNYDTIFVAPFSPSKDRSNALSISFRWTGSINSSGGTVGGPRGRFLVFRFGGYDVDNMRKSEKDAVRDDASVHDPTGAFKRRTILFRFCVVLLA